MGVTDSVGGVPYIDLRINCYTLIYNMSMMDRKLS